MVPIFFLSFSFFYFYFLLLLRYLKASYTCHEIFTSKHLLKNADSFYVTTLSFSHLIKFTEISWLSLTIFKFPSSYVILWLVCSNQAPSTDQPYICLSSQQSLSPLLCLSSIHPRGEETASHTWFCHWFILGACCPFCFHTDRLKCNMTSYRATLRGL